MNIYYENKLALSLKYKLYLGGLIVVSTLIIAAAGYLFYIQRADAVRLEKYNELKAISDLKVSQIENWLHDRSADAKIVAQSPFFIEGINRWLQDTANEQLKNDIIKRLQPVQKELGYKDIFLVSTNGHFLLSVKGTTEIHDSILLQKIKETTIKREIVISDFYRCPIENTIHFDIIAPIIHDENQVIAALVFRRDPSDFLFPLIQDWPTPSKSAETAILRVESDSVVFLNELRHRETTALKLKIPLTQTEVPAVKAALGHVGLFEGSDYRGVKVLSDIRTIPGINWIMLSKVDTSEIYADLSLTAGIITSFTILLIIACGIGFSFIYNARQKKIYRELYVKEKELWGQQEKFKVTMDSLGEGIITLDIKGKVQYMNKFAQELTGWNLREARGRELHAIYPVKNEETGKRENNILDKIYKQGIVKELANHTLLISKSGKEIPVMDTGAPVYDNDGTIIGIVIAFLDETEKRAQQKLIKESEEKYKSLIENSQDAILINHNNQFVYVNPAGLRLFAAGNENQILGKTPFDFFHPDYHELIKSRIAKVKGNEIAQYIDEKIINLKGEVVDVEVGAIPYIYKNNNALQVIIKDITERKLVEKKLFDSNLRFNRLVSELNEVVWTADIDGSEILDINESVESIYGVSIEEFKNKPNLWIDIVHPDDRAIAEASKKELFEKGKAHAEYRIVRPDGKIVWLLDRKSLIYDRGGNAVQMGGIAKDITERKLAEEKIRERSEDLALINALNNAINRGDTLDEIVALMSKEIMRIFNCFGTITSFTNPDKSFLLPTNFQFPSPLIENLEKLTGAGLQDLPLKLPLKGNGKIASVMREGFPAAFNDEREIIEVMAEFTENKKLKQLAPAIFKLLHYRSMVLIPLVSENEIYGMLEISRYVQTSDEELNRLKLIAGQLTQAIGRKLAEEKVIDERNNATQYFEAAGIMLVILDKTGKVIRINKKGCDVLQYAKSEIVGKDWFKFLPENNANEVRTSFKQLMKDEIEGMEFYDNPVVNRDGEERLIEWHNVILRDTNGKPVGTLSSGEDITKRRQSEELIREKEEHFRRTLELGVVGIATTHPYTYYFLSANQRLCEMIGYTEDELLQKTWAEITFPKEKVDEDAANVEKLLSGELNGYVMEKQYQHKDGHMIDITLSVQGVQKKDGTIDYILILIDDITAEKQNEKVLLAQRNLGITTNALSDLNELYRVSMESLFDISGMDCGMIYLFDEEQKKLDMVYSKGLSEQFVSVTSHYDEHSDNVKFVKLGKPAFVNYSELPVELGEIERAEKLVSVAILPIVNKGTVIGCFNLASHKAIFMPVTVQKGIEVMVTLISNAIVRIKTEEDIRNLNESLEVKVKERTEQLSQARIEADRANVAKSEFLSRMSHELRTPLNSILGFAQLLNRTETNHENTKRIKQIMKSGTHLLDLINEVLDLARIESGRLSLSLEPVQLGGIIMESLEIVSPLAEKSEIKLELAVSPLNNLFVTADRQKLKQVLINLINNAVKYNRKGGKVEIFITQTVYHVRISVRDTGIGIAAEELHKLFEPFKRIGAEISEVEGTGLGLAVAKKLVDAMQGTIGVESKAGVGSTFWVELPQAESQLEHNGQTRNRNKAQNRDSISDGTILYIEDNFSNIQLVEDILEAERPSVRLVVEMYGKNAVKMATDYQPALILLDLDLPDIHGSEVFELLQTEPTTKNIPVVVLSANAMAHSINQLMAAGAKHYLTKPLDVDRFLEVADEILNKG